ncbi:LapA family protein [Mycobacterium sp. C31M]
MTTDPHALPLEPEQPLEPLGTSEPPPPPEDNVKFTRAAALWSALIIGFLVLIVLLIFISQNTDPGTFHFLGWNWTLPLGVALLLAAVGGGLLAVLVGAARIVQLRIAARKNLKAARRASL